MSQVKKGRKYGRNKFAADGATAILGLAKEASTGIPIQMKENKEEWLMFAEHVSSIRDEILDRFKQCQEAPTGLLEDISKLNPILAKIKSIMEEMRDRHYLARLAQARDDPKRIAELRLKLDSALQVFNAKRGIAIEQKIHSMNSSLQLMTTTGYPRSAFASSQTHRIKCCPPPIHLFTGREDILNRMTSCFRSESRCVVVLHGLGGSGKTQIALKFVEMSQKTAEPPLFSAVYFVDATNLETLISDCDTIARTKAREDTVEQALDWLREERDNWLLILNNADDTSLNIRKYFPNCGHGNIIITTRNRDIIRHASSLNSDFHVSGMTPEDATSLLLRTARLNPDQDDGMALLIVKEFGYLALAIVQAGAYISKSDCSLETYLELHRASREALLEKYRDDVQKIDEYPSTVFTTWSVSFLNLGKADPIACTLLQLCSFLHHDGISEDIFRNASAHMWGFSLESKGEQSWNDALASAKEFLTNFIHHSDKTWNSLRFMDVLASLKSYSLVEADSLNNIFSIHPLVHQWTRTKISNVDSTSRTAQLILSLSVNPADRSTEEIVHGCRIIPHIDAVLEFCGARESNICTRLAAAYYDAWRWNAAESLQAWVVESRKRLLGKDHPDTLSAMASLAMTLSRDGRHLKSEELQVLVVQTRMQVLGEEHLDTLRSTAEMVRIYERQGRLKEAEDIGLRGLNVAKRVLGEQHSVTLAAMNNLALIYGAKSRWEEAQKLLCVVLGFRKKILQDDHPQTLVTMEHLAWTYRLQGKWKDAANIQLTVLPRWERILGHDHPDTLSVMISLGYSYFQLGRFEDAARLEHAVVDARRRTLGEDHLDTLFATSTLAQSYAKLDRWKEVAELHSTVIEVWKRTLGEDHEDTLSEMISLADAYFQLERFEDAARLEQAVVDALKRTLGEDHENTLSEMIYLADTYFQLDRFEDAAKLQVIVADTRRRTIGKDHVDTLFAMDELASSYEELDRWKEAAELRSTIVEVRKRTLGEDDEDTLSEMMSLGNSYFELDRFEDAAKLEQAVVDTRRRSLGDDHLDTLFAMRRLARIYEQLNRWKETAELRSTVVEVRKRTVGEDHRDTLSEMMSLASAYFQLDRYEETEELELTVWEVRKRVLGEDHEDTLEARKQLGYTRAHVAKARSMLGRLKLAAQKYRPQLRLPVKDSIELLMDLCTKSAENGSVYNFGPESFGRYNVGRRWT